MKVINFIKKNDVLKALKKTELNDMYNVTIIHNYVHESFEEDLLIKDIFCILDHLNQELKWTIELLKIAKTENVNVKDLFLRRLTDLSTLTNTIIENCLEVE